MATAIPKAYLASSAIRCRDVETGPNRGGPRNSDRLLRWIQRWTPSTGQLIDVAKWNLLRYIPVKMRGAEDDKAETAKSFTSL